MTRTLWGMGATDKSGEVAGTYPIRAVSRLTGISVDLLRVWERRYQAVEPARSGRGRVYSDADVSRLGKLRRLVDCGYSIGHIAGLSDADLDRLGEKHQAARADTGRDALASARMVSPDLSRLSRAVEQYDANGLDRELGRLAALLPPKELAREVVQPLMCWIGEQWERGSLGIAQEHCASMAIRNLIGSLVRMPVRSSNGTVMLFATPSGQHHEFGVMCSALIAAGAGVSGVFIGADVPSDDIVRAAKATGAHAVVLGVGVACVEHDSLKAVSDVVTGVGESVEVWVGGCKDASLGEALKSLDLSYVADFDEFERHLVRIGGDCT